MKRSVSRKLAALTLAVGTVVLSVIAGPAPTTADTAQAQQSLTVRQVYHQVEARLAQSGKIYKAVVRHTVRGGGIRQSDVTQVWVDARHDRARQQTTSRLTDSVHGQTYTYTFTVIYAGAVLYTHGFGTAAGQPTVQTGPANTCEGAHIAASVILGCPDPVQTWTMSVQSGRYAGRQVLVLLRKGTDSSEGVAALRIFTTRIYLDGQTLLPLEETSTGTINTSDSKPGLGGATYVTSMVNPSSLPLRFFQPSSLGYRGRADQIRQEMKPVPSGFAVLWLGLDFPGGQGLPALSLQRAVALGGEKDPFSIELYYAPAGNLWGTPLLYMEEQSSASRFPMPKPPRGPGWTRQTVKLANGHAVIVSGRDTQAFAYIGSTVALIEAPAQPGVPVRPGRRPPPRRSAYSSVAAMRTVVRALRPYVPHR